MPDIITLQAICGELKIASREVRKRLRTSV